MFKLVKKLLGIIVLGLLLSGKAYAKDLPILECSIIEDGNVVGSQVWDLNSSLYIITRITESEILWTSFPDKGIKVFHTANRRTGTYSVKFESSTQTFTWFGKCEPGSLEKKF